MAEQTDAVVAYISNLNVGTVVAWILVIAAIIGAIGGIFIKLYKIFEKTNKIKLENIDLKEMVKSHDSQLKEINKRLENITDKLDKQEQSDIKKMRYSIVKSGEEAIIRGSMTIREYRSLRELYEDYHTERNGVTPNGYVTSLIRKVEDNVQIVGELDEDGNDKL